MDRDLVERAARVTPSARQLAWQQMELTAFLHFTVNTFTDREWGDGTESPAIFNPVECDPRQWIRELRDAGFKMAILTAKHHDGFCLWPSRFTAHSVKNSPWKNGQGDVVREFTDACREFGIKAGIYLSPWDRHEPCYGDSPRYNRYFMDQLRELATGYGEIACFWFDGACAEGPNGKVQRYDWDAYFALIRELQPNAMIDDIGPDARWCGNEAGRGREAEWSVINLNKTVHAFNQEDATKDDVGSLEFLGRGENLIWYPSEVDTSIRPGWFYHASEDDQVKSLKKLVDIYFNSVGGNAVLLLNLPPDRRGLLHENDVARIRELRTWLDDAFARNLALDATLSASAALPDHAASCVVDGRADTYWTVPDWTESAVLTLSLAQPRTFNCLLLQEYIPDGQRISSFTLEAEIGGQWRMVAEGQTVGYKKLLRFVAVTASRVRLTFRARLAPTLMTLGLYQVPDVVESVVSRRGTIIPAEQLKLVSVTSGDGAASLLTGQGRWCSAAGLPQEITIDFGRTLALEAMVVSPVTDSRDGHPLHYELQLAPELDNLSQMTALRGEFANTVNNPLPQTIKFASVLGGRYARLRILSTNGGAAFVQLAGWQFVLAE